jgi:hypothetical protein
VLPVRRSCHDHGLTGTSHGPVTGLRLPVVGLPETRSHGHRDCGRARLTRTLDSPGSAGTGTSESGGGSLSGMRPSGRRPCRRVGGGGGDRRPQPRRHRAVTVVTVAWPPRPARRARAAATLTCHSARRTVTDTPAVPATVPATTVTVTPVTVTEPEPRTVTVPGPGGRRRTQSGAASESRAWPGSESVRLGIRHDDSTVTLQVPSQCALARPVPGPRLGSDLRPAYQ